MITIEIQQDDLRKNKKLIKSIYRKWPTFSSRHFFYEPKLIIRSEDWEYKQILLYLIEKKIGYKTYKYPFPKKGFGESKRSVIIKYDYFFRSLMNETSILAVRRNKKDDYKILERYNHTFINQLGYEWEDESLFYTQLAAGRIGCIRKYMSKSLATTLLCYLIFYIFKLNHFLIKLLK